ncbi:MAG: hypothetical protein COA94_05825 [Rickettsiales bacterium]|nr:MAG: hypothetical protein COA94_05825 [Rickettsiales bacterium]
MDLPEIYALLFTDTLVSNFAFNASSEMVTASMKIFGTYNPYHVILIASAAFFIVSCVNYLLGIICYKIVIPFNSKEADLSRITNLRKSRYLIIIMMLSAVPFFGKFVMLFAGFCGVRPGFAIFTGSLAKLVYYSFFMLAQ